MRKKILIIIMFGLSGMTMANANQQTVNNASSIVLDELKYGKGMISVGKFNVSYTETIKLKPDVVTFSITYLTEGDTPNEASNLNANNMKKLKDYLAKLGIKENDLTTISYNNYAQQQNVPLSTNTNQFRSNFKVNLNIKQAQFFDVVQLLDKNDIDGLKLDSTNHLYEFNIQSIADSAEDAKQLTQQKYKLITNQLNKIGIENITVSDYTTKPISPAEIEVKKFYVTNTIQIKNNDFENTGKIINKAQSLKMMVNNDMNYSLSEAEKDSVLAQHEQTIYSKLAEKATRLLGQQYLLGAPQYLNSSQNSDIYQLRNNRYNYSMDKMLNSGQQNQLHQAEDINIEAPAEFNLVLTMSGTFDIVRQIQP